MSMTNIAIENNRTLIVLVFAFIVSGIFAYQGLPKQQDPGFTIRTAAITTRFEGASPERVEQLVTKKIEEKIQEMPEIDFITSESRSGISIIMANFKESYTDMRPIFDTLRRKVENTESELPTGVSKPDVNDEFGDVFGSVYSLTGSDFSYTELKNIADEIRDRLLIEPEIAKVSIHGAQQEMVFVDYKNTTLLELGISPQQLSASLSKLNIVSTGGNILSGRERVVLEPTGNFETVEDIQRTVIELPNSELVYLSDIANVYLGYVDPPDSVSLINGSPALAIAISMRDGGDILKLGKRLDQLIPEIEASYPWGIQMEKIWFQADLVKTNIDAFVGSLLQSVSIVIVVMVLFLGLRTGLVVATLIPSTIIVTFYLMHLFSITINQVSLAAMIIALGLLVDNAIVVVESIIVKQQHGLNPVQAAVQSANELKIPLLVSSLTTAAAFMPIALAESAVGEYTADIFYVVTLSLLTSWLLAMTFIPYLTTHAIKTEAQTNETEEEELNGIWYQRYQYVLNCALKHRIVFFSLVIIIFFSSLQLFRFIPQIFVPPSTDPLFTGKIEMPLGTSIESSQTLIDDLNQFIEKEYYLPEGDAKKIKNWMVFIGEGGPRFDLGLDPPNPNPANSFLVANTVDGDQVDEVINGIRQYLTQYHPDAAHQISRKENGPPVGYPIVIRLRNENLRELYKAAESMTELLYQNNKILSVKNSWGLQTKKLIVEVDQARAQRAGISSEDVAYSLRTSLSGDQLTQYRDGDKLIPIMLRTDATDRQDISKLEGMNIYSQSTGQVVPLKQVADIKLRFEPGLIEHRDRIRTMALQVQLLPGNTATEVLGEITPELDRLSQTLPKNTAFEIGGEAEESGESNQSIAEKLPIAGLAILVLLVMQFNSLRKPVMILVTIPFGLIGVATGLILGQSSMGFFTLLGIIALSGIIINNAIVLIDRIDIEIDSGLPAQEAIVHACKQRLRPILLATATTSLGMLPLWWGGNTMFQPLAISIIFGLLFATLLTLLVIPTLYSVLYRIRF